MDSSIEILLGDVNDVEAHVFARCKVPLSSEEQPESSLAIAGTLRGPYCVGTRTLPAEFHFREFTGRNRAGLAEVIIPHPCLWSPDLPHLYHVDVRAIRLGQVVAEYRGEIGLRRTTPRREGIAFPG